ncbi:hypothetical protein ACXR2U_05155 [Jatrophihabitans sp. YIM 134969]
MPARPSAPHLTAARVTALLLVLAVLGGLAGFLVDATRPTRWQSDRQALIRVWSIDSLVLSGQTTPVGSTDLAGAVVVVTSSDVLTAAAAALGETGVTARSLAADVTASASDTSDFVQITATGPDAAEADRRAQAVADAFVAVVRQKVLASASQIAALTAGGTTQGQSDIQIRAQAVAALDPVQVYRSDNPERQGTTPSTAAALGAIAGLTLGALLVVLAAFGAPRLRRPADVAASLGLPSLVWSERDDPVTEDGLAADLIRAAGSGSVVVVPARPQDSVAAGEFAAWLQGSRPATTSAGEGVPGHGVVRIESPVAGLAASRPVAAGVGTAVLVTTAGATTETITQAAALLEGWRPVDAVVLVG